MIVCAAAALALTCPPAVPEQMSPSPVVEPAPAGEGGPCVASFYGEAHRGLTTASGAPFDPDAFTVAAWDHDFGSVLAVHHGGETVEVEVTDRGPARSLDRCLDLSAAAFEALAPRAAGVIDVTYEVVR